MKTNRYTFHGQLPSHCERVATYWATLTGFQIGASGKARAKRYLAVRAFMAGLAEAQLPESMIHQAYTDTLELVRVRLMSQND